MLNLRKLEEIRRKDPYLGETLQELQKAVNRVSSQLGVDPTGAVKKPEAPLKLEVVASGGYYDVKIVDPSPKTSRPLFYFVEYATDSKFRNPMTVFMGTSRSLRLALGNQNLFFRAYSQYFGSATSDKTRAAEGCVILGGGTETGPEIPPEQPPGGPVDEPPPGTGGGGGFGDRHGLDLP